jgi:hypothetical protein
MTKTNLAPKPRTEAIPVTTMVDVPVLSEEERAEVIASLHEAEEDIRAGRAKTFTADEFERWLAERAKDIRTKKSSK